MTNIPESEVQGFDDAPRKNFKIPKWSIVLGAIIAVLVVIALIIPSFLDQDKYKSLIIQKVEESTGYKVAWAGDLGISILPVPHVTINEATVSSGDQRIVAVKKGEISVALMPLFQKQVQISSVKLIEPDINLLVDASGRQTWMTPKMQEQKAQSEKQANPSTPNDEKTQSITLDSVYIEKGHVVYKDDSKKEAHEVSDLNADLSLKNLTGPFDIDADLVYNGNQIAVKGETGEIVEGKPTSVDFDIALPKLDVSGNYKGEITTGDNLSVKGDLKLSAKDLENTMAAFSKDKPQLPEGLNGALHLSTAVIYDGDTASLDKLDLALGDLAYKGSLKVVGLKTSASPKLSVDLESTSGDIKAANALIKILSDLSVKGTGTFVNNIVTIEQGVIGFEGQTINLTGNYALPQQAGARPKVNATIKAGKIDIDDIQRQLNPSTESAAQKVINEKVNQAQSSVKIKGMTLPFDGTIAASVGSLSFGGKTYSNINAGLTSSGKSLSISNLSLGTVADTTVAVKGTIADLEKLSGFDLTANAKTGNVEGLAKAYNYDLKLDRTLGAASIAGAFKGSLENMAFNATVDALNFAVTGAGNVKSALENPQIEGLNIRIRHPSLQTAVRNFSPSFEAPGSFNGPLDVSSLVSLNNKKYELSNISGSIGSTSIAGKVSADMSSTKPSVNGDLNFGNMVFDSAAPKAGTTTTSSKPSSAPAASSSETRWSREAIDTSWMSKFNADLAIKAASITQGLWKLNNANLSFKLNDGSLNIGNMSAQMFGGDAAINGNMKGGTAQAPLSMNWSAKANNINAQQLLSAVQNKQSDTLSGMIKSFNLDIASSGISPAALVYALSGKGNINGDNIVIKGVDAAKLAETAKGSFKPLERAGSLLSSFKDGQTAFSTFNADFTIASGVVNFSQIKFDGQQALLTSTGNINLPRWTIDLKNNMTVKNSEVPPFDFTISGPLDNPAQAGGSIIEGFLREKATEKVQKLITDKLGDKLGFPLGGAAKTATPEATKTPAAETDTTVAPVEKTKEQKKQEQIQEGVKALQGLFGQ